MTDETVELERRADVAIVRLNDPATLNAVTVPMLDALHRAVDEAAASARAMILTGAGRGFCSGANIGAGMESTVEDAGTYDAGLALRRTSIRSC